LRSSRAEDQLRITPNRSPAIPYWLVYTSASLDGEVLARPGRTFHPDPLVIQNRNTLQNHKFER